MKKLALSFALLSAGTTSAWAVEYNQLQPDKSSVDFTYEQMGVSMDGHFKKIQGEVSFDPAKPERAKAVLDVDLTGIDTGSPENDEEVTGKSWFNTASFPQAHFELTKLTPKGGNNYEAAGKLSIKGVSKDIVAPATFAEQGNTGVFEGTFVLKRGDYAIGEGEWSSFDVVANDIKIKVRIAASAK
ncbi:polyisoprenoid-binding protein [Pseudomonas oryzihabitans]|nr:polyisoprenoid-binding protein [Pseudomonas psychrotolerans]KTT45512.1 polyisoprenoid-binding protein [Pseudomonas psychrotolerans]